MREICAIYIGVRSIWSHVHCNINCTRPIRWYVHVHVLLSLWLSYTAGVYLCLQWPVPCCTVSHWRGDNVAWPCHWWTLQWYPLVCQWEVIQSLVLVDHCSFSACLGCHWWCYRWVFVRVLSPGDSWGSRGRRQEWENTPDLRTGRRSSPGQSVWVCGEAGRYQPGELSACPVNTQDGVWHKHVCKVYMFSQLLYLEEFPCKIKRKSTTSLCKMVIYRKEMKTFFLHKKTYSCFLLISRYHTCT